MKVGWWEKITNESHRLVLLFKSYSYEGEQLLWCFIALIDGMGVVVRVRVRRKKVGEGGSGTVEIGNGEEGYRKGEKER